MRLLTVFVFVSIFNTSIKAQEQVVKKLSIDTLSGSFLLENDYRLNSLGDIIFRPSSIICQTLGNSLKSGYKRGVFLLGDSLSLGNYKNRVISYGYKIMESQKFQHLLSQKVNENNEKTSIERYQFLTLKLIIVVGYLGIQEIPVMWKDNKIKQKKVPLYYVLEVL